MFDTVIRYPFQTAVVILALYLLRIVWYMLPGIGGKRAADHRDGVSRSADYRTQSRVVRNGDERHQKDFRMLTSRIDGMEEKTNLLSERLEQLYRSVDSLSRSMSDEENGDER